MSQFRFRPSKKNFRVSRFWSATLLLAISAPVFGVVQEGGFNPDEPNTAFEQRLFRIYSQHTPVSQSRWAEIVGDHEEELYSVQAGDTLWDISLTFFGDGFFWSKLWAENSSFENPHEIRPGQVIRFISGTESNAPSIGLEDSAQYLSALDPLGVNPSAAAQPLLAGASSEVIRINSMTVSSGKRPVYKEQALKKMQAQSRLRGARSDGFSFEESELISEPEIPAQSRVVLPPLRSLPDSFVQPFMEQYVNAYDNTGLDAGKVTALTVPALVIANSFIVDRELEVKGRIIEIEAGEAVASNGQDIFLQLSTPAKPGDQFSVFHLKEKLKVRAFDLVGPVVEVGGTVEIQGLADAREGVYRARVILSVNPIRTGSIISSLELPKGTYSRTDKLSSVEAHILGGEFDANRKVLGDGAVVYLDAGRQAGLREGDILPIQGQRSTRRSGSKVPNWQKPIGLLKVIKVEETVATAFVLEARDVILVGDRTGITAAGVK